MPRAAIGPGMARPSEHIVSLEVVLADGNIARLEKHSIPSTISSNQENRTESISHGIDHPPLSRLVNGLDGILTRHRKAIENNKTRLNLNRSGYSLRDLRTGDKLDLARLLAGSEGSLALVTEATLATVPLPNHAGSLLFFFHSLENAIHAAKKLASEQLTACVLMDRRHLNLARESDPRFELLIPQAAEAVLLMEHHADTSDHLLEKLEHTRQHMQEESKLAADCSIATDPLDHRMLWQLAEYYVPSFYQLKGSTRPIPFIEEIIVPPEMLPDMLNRLQTALNKEQVTASIFGQPLQGQLHIRPLLDLANARDVRKMTALAEQVYEHAWACDGIVCGEHGNGLSRIPYSDRQFGPLADAYREIKLLFDPQGILNPGKVVTKEICRLTDNLRPTSYPLLDPPALPPALVPELRTSRYQVTQRQPTRNSGQAVIGPESAPVDSADKSLPGGKELPLAGLVELQLDWQPDEMALTARTCNGCAACRTQDAGIRMCPIFRIAPREEASPRAKANLARGILTGQLPPETIHESEFKQIADLCVHCHMCRLECPSHVDIPKLMIEAKGAYLATNGQGFHDWVLMHIDSLCKIASRLSRISNWVISNRVARWIAEKSLGIAQGRKLPHLAPRPYLQIAMARGLHRPYQHGACAASQHASLHPRVHSPKSQRDQPHVSQLANEERSALLSQPDKVLYFVDTFANHCDTRLADALVAILEHNGVSVYIPNTQREAAMPMIAQGMLEPARQIAEQNVALLAEAVRQGYTIVSTEPSAVLALSHEYPLLLGDDLDAKLVAANTTTACHFLLQRHQRGALHLNFSPLNITVGYHPPCHLKALEIGHPAIHLLNLIPELKIISLEEGCCGMAGVYGLKHTNYRNSLRAGLPLLTAIRSGSFQAGITECSTCKLQMEQGTPKPTIHPIHLIAHAYGLNSPFHQSPNSPIQELLTT